MENFNKTKQLRLVAFITALFFAFTMNVFAQVAQSNNYTFSTGSTGNLALDMNSNAIDLSSQPDLTIPGTSTTLATMDIGFDFWFMGTRYFQLTPTVRGTVGLGPITVNSATPNLNQVVANTAPILAPFWNNNTFTPGIGRNLRTKLVGTAPNRCFVFEWRLITNSSYYGAGDMTFQMRLYETSGIVEYVYGNMAITTGSVSAIVNQAAIGFTVNNNLNNRLASVNNLSTYTNTFNPSFVNNAVVSQQAAGPIAGLSAGRYFRYAPAVPAAPTLLTFSGISNTSMTLNWVDNSANEVGFAIYRSDDNGATFNYITLVPQNVNTFTQSLLNPGITYQYRVVAVSEGGNSTNLTGTQASTAATVITSTVGGGLWSSATTWVGGIVPNINNNVTIANGATVIIDVLTATCNNLTVGAGVSGTLSYSSTSSATLFVNGNVTVSAGAIFNAGISSIQTHNLIIGGFANTGASGNLIVNGTFNLSSVTSPTSGAGVITTFAGQGNGSISGTGATCNFFAIVVNKGIFPNPLLNNQLDVTRIITINTPTTSTNRLTINAGTFRVSSASVLTPYNGSQTICNTGGRLWLNNAACSVGQMNAGTLIGAGSPTILGELRIDNGTFNYGSGNNTMNFNTSAVLFNGISTTFGSRLEMNGGTLNMYGAMAFTSSPAVFFNMTAGNINVDAQSANILSSGSTVFTINASTSVNWSGGTVTIVDPAAALTTTATVNIITGGQKNIRGGTLQIGDGISGSGSGPVNNSTGFLLNITAPIWNLVINARMDISNTRICRLGAGPNLIYNNVTVNANSYLMLGSAGASGTLALYGDLTNNGIISGVEPNSTGVTGVLQFIDSTGTQTVSGTGTFPNILQITLAPALSFNSSSNNVIFNQTNNIVVNNVVLATGTLTHNGKLIIGRPGSLPLVQLGGFGQTVAPGRFASVPTFDNTSYATQYNYLTCSTPYVLGASNEISANTNTLFALTVASHKGLTIDRNLTLVAGLTMTLGNLSIGNNNLTLGSGLTNIGTLTYTSGNIICGATGKFTRWYNTTAAPTSLAAASQFPLGGLTDVRHAWVYLSATNALSTAGTISVRHANIQGLSAMTSYTENAVSMDTRTNSNWVFSVGNGLTLGTGTIAVALRGDGALLGLTSAANNTITDASGAALAGTFAAGSGTLTSNMILNPQATRTAIPSFAALTTNPIYIGTPTANAQSINTAIANGNWNTAANWSSGSVPVITDNVIIPLGVTISTSVGAACVANLLVVQPGGTLNVDGNTLTITRNLYVNGLTNNRETYGIINVSAGTLTVTGDALAGGYIATAWTVTNITGGTFTVGSTTDCSKQISIPASAIFNIYGGTINVYGSVNFAGIVNQTAGTMNLYPLGPIGGPITAAASATSHTFSLTNTACSFSGGNINVIDPPFTAANSIYNATSGLYVFTGNHTITLGDGISTATNGIPFRMETYQSSYVPLQNLIVNGGNTVNRHAESSTTAGSYGLHVKGTLTVNSGSEFRHTTANQLYIGSALVNNGTFTQLTTTPLILGMGIITGGFGNTTVSGTGVFQNATTAATASFTNLQISAGNVANRVIINVNNLSVSGTLTLTAGQLDLGSNNFILGNVGGSLSGALTHTAGSQILTSTGGSFTRVYPIGALPTSVATGNTGHYPFGKFNTLNNTVERRDAFVFSSNSGTLTTGGSITVTPTPVNGNSSVTSFNDGTLLNVTNRTNTYWNFSNAGIVLGTGNISIRTIGENAGISTLAGNVANTTLMLNSTAANGTYSAGTNFLANLTAPDFNRNGLVVADISNVSYYGGVQGTSNIGGNFVAINNGDWNNAATWSAGSVPTAADNVQIPPPYTVVVGSATNNLCNNLTINSGGTLIANSNNLSIAGQLINFGTVLVGGSTLSINNSNVLGLGIINQSGATLTLNAGTINIGPIGGGMATLNNLGTLSINAGTCNLNGNFIHGGSAFNMVSGNFNIDGNNNSALTSVPFGTIIASLTGVQTVTGGTITIVDPPFIGSALAFSNTAVTNAWTNNVLRFGDGISTDGNNGFIAVTAPASNQSTGFGISSVSTNLGNVVANGNSGSRIVSINGTTLLATSLTINNGSEFRSTANTSTASNLALTGNLINNGILTSAINNTLTLQGTVQQNVSGTGVFKVDTLGNILSNINNLSCSNSSLTGIVLSVGNLTIGGNATVSGSLSLAGAGPLNIGSNTLTLGTSALLPGTLASATGTIIHSTGGKFARWYSATAAPTTAATTSQFPLGILVNGTVLRRDFYAFSSTAALTTGGTFAVSHTPVAGTTTITAYTDGTVTGINTRSNTYWNVVNTGITSAGTFGVNAVANGILFPVVLASTTLSSSTGILSGTIGTTTGTQASPNLVRTLVSLADLTNSSGLYVSSSSTNFVGNIFTVAGGNWSDTSIWSTGTVPTANDNVTINANHYVTLDANGATRDLTLNGFGGLIVNANTLTVNNILTTASAAVININGGTVNVLATIAGTANGYNSSGNLNLLSGTLNISQPLVNNRTFTSAGTTNIAGGNLNVNGNINYSAGTWQQSGGTITVNGNNGSAAGSVASATNIVQFTGITHIVTGGTMIIVNPHFGPTGLAFNYNASTSTNWTNHTLQFGDGVSTIMSGAVATVGTTVANLGFGVSTTTATATGRITLHNVIINGLGTNRHVSVATSTVNSLDIGNNLTINTGCDLRTIGAATALTGGINVGGNIINNGRLVIGSNTTLGFRLNATTQTLNNQVVSGTGTFLNDTLATSSPCFSNININSYTTQGVTMSALSSPITIDQPLGAISSALTFSGTASYLNLGSNNIVLGGSAIKPGTLTGTFTGNNNLIMTTGSFKRWFNAATAISGTVGTFPIGLPNTPINLNRVLTLTSTLNPTVGGSITVSHANVAGATALTSFVDGTATIDRRSNSSWNITTSGLTAGGGAFLNMQVQASGLSSSNITNVNDLRITGVAAAAAGLPGVNSGSILDPVLTRTGFSESTIASSFYIGGNASNSLDYPVITGNSLTGTQTICAGSIPTAITGSNPSGGTGNFTYTWLTSTTDATSGFAVSAGTNNGVNYSPAALSANTWYRRLVISGNNRDTSVAVAISINQLVANNTVSGAGNVCAGNVPSTITGSTPTGGNGTSYTYLWQSSTTSASAGYGAAAGTNNNSSYSPGALSVNTWYRRIVASGVCAVDTGTAVAIGVYTPLLSNTITGTQTICSGTIPTVINGSTPTGSMPTGLTKINEDFNGGAVPTNWTLTNASSLLVASTTINSYSRTGTAGAYKADFYNISSGDAQFASKTFGATNASDSLRFDIASKSYPGSYDSVFVLANNGSGFAPLASWVIAQTANTSSGGITTLAASTSGYNSPAAGDWFTKALALPVGTTQVRFDFKSDYGNNVYIDRVIVDSSLAYSYNWQSSTTSATSGFASASGTNNAANYTPAALTQNTWYRRVATGMCAADTSLTQQISIINAPTITAQPSNATVGSGSNTSFTVAATGVGISYQWQVNSGTGFVNVTNAGVYSNATTATLNITAAVIGMNTYTYRCVVTGTCLPVANSNSATLTVNTAPAITTQPINATVCSAANASYTVVAVGVGLTYQWQVNTGAGFVNLTNTGVYSNTTNATLNITGASTTMNGYLYQCIVTAVLSSTSNSASLTVNIPVANNVTSGNSAVCPGSTPAALTGTTPTGGNGTTYTYLWQSSTLNATSGYASASGTNNTSGYIPGAISVNTWYRRVVASGACAADSSIAIAITAVSPLTNNIATGVQTICSGSVPATLNGSYALNGKPNGLIRMTEDFNGGLLSNNYTITANVGTLAKFNSIRNSYGRTGTTGAIFADNYNVAAGNYSDIDSRIISPSVLGDSLRFDVAHAYLGAGFIDSLRILTSTGSGFTNRLAVWGSKSVIDTVNGITTAILNGYFTPTASQWCNKKLALPVGTTQIRFEFYSGYGTSLYIDRIIIDSVVPYVYTWQKSTTSATTGFTAATGTNNNINYSPAAISTNTWFRRIVSATCVDTSSAIQVSVNPTIANNTVTGVQSICSGSATSALSGSTPTGGTGTFTYLWQSSNTSSSTGFAAASGTNNLIGYNAGSLTASTWYRRILTSGACVDSSAAIAVTVNPIITSNTASGTQTICSGMVPTTLTGSTPAGGNGTYSYIWQRSNTSSIAGFSAAPLTNNAINYTSSALTANAYFRRVINSGACADTSAAISVTVNPALANNTSGATQTICNGLTASLTGGTVTGGSGVYTYQWQASTSGSNIGFANATGTSTTANYTSGAITSNVWFRRVTTSGTCVDSSNAIKLTPAATLANNTIAGASLICVGSSPAALTGSTPTGGAVATFNRFTEEFNGGALSPNFTISSNSGSLAVLSSTVNSYGRTGTAGSIYANNYNITAGNYADLDSRIMNPTSAGDSLRFDVAHAYYGAGYVDSLRILTSNGSGFTQLISWGSSSTIDTINGITTALLTGLFTPSAAQWCNKKVALPVGTTQVRFEMYSGYGTSLYLDRIMIDSSTTYQYTWQSSNTSATAGFANASGINTNAGYAPSSLLQNTWFRRVASAVCVDTSSAVAITVNTPGTWVGNTSNAWANTANWSCPQIPTATTNVTIPTGSANMPVIINAQQANNIAIQSAASLTLNVAASQLSVFGNITNNGSFTNSNGKLIFTGSAAQTIPTGTYAKVQVNNAAGLTLGGAVTLNDSLVLTNGIVSLANNNLTLGSTAYANTGSTTSYIKTNGTGSAIINGIGTTGKTGNIAIPVGNASFNPIVFANSGTTDNFTVRVIDSVTTTYSGSTPTGAKIIANAVGKSWIINEAVAGGSNANITLQWNTADELTGFARANSYLAYHNGTIWMSNVAGAASGSNPYTQTRSGITSFSAFGVGSAGTLPVELITFNGKRVNEKAELNWVTASEVNNDYFIVERSSNNKTFTAIGEKVKGAGNSNTVNQYQVYDNDAIAFATQNAIQTIYYRLRQVDFDGTINYSKVISISATEDAVGFDASVYPNPFNGTIHVNVSTNTNEETHLEVYDLNGKTVYSQTITTLVGNTNFMITDLDKIPAGMYFVKISQSDNTKIVKISKVNN